VCKKDKRGKDKEGKTRGIVRGIVRENKYGRFLKSSIFDVLVRAKISSR
jgi:hypothetical protein